MATVDSGGVEPDTRLGPRHPCTAQCPRGGWGSSTCPVGCSRCKATPGGDEHVLGATPPALVRLGLATALLKFLRPLPQRGATAGGHGAPRPAHVLPLLSLWWLRVRCRASPLPEAVSVTPPHSQGCKELSCCWHVPGVTAAAATVLGDPAQAEGRVTATGAGRGAGHSAGRTPTFSSSAPASGAPADVIS